MAIVPSYISGVKSIIPDTFQYYREKQKSLRRIKGKFSKLYTFFFIVIIQERITVFNTGCIFIKYL